MEHDHRFPIVVTDPDGKVRKPIHLQVGPGLTIEGETTAGAAPVTILWAWSAAIGKAFPLLVTEAALVPVPGRSDRWTIDTGELGVWRLRYDRSASCCGDPMKRFRPPGTGAARRSTSDQ
jgi:hypothetical protein